MTNQCIHLKGNFIEVLDFFCCDPSWSKPKDDARTTIEKDIPRISMLSRKYSRDAIESKLRAKVVSGAYVQGNYDGRLFGSLFNMHKTLECFSVDVPNSQDMLTHMKDDFHFAYIDTKGNPCAFAIVYQAKSPKFFNVCHVKKTTGAPQDREYHFFQSTDNHIYPELDTLMPKCSSSPIADKIDVTSLKHKLFEIEDLPEEIQFAINDLVTKDGTLDLLQIEQLKKDITPISAVDAALFSNDFLLAELKSYQAIFTLLKQQLNDINTEEKEQLNAVLEEHLLSIKKTLAANKPVIQLGEDSYLHQTEIMQKKLIECFSQPVFKQKYDETLKPFIDRFLELDAIRQKSFFDKNTTGVIVSSAFTLLNVTCLAISLTGILAPIGLAALITINVLFSIANIASWIATASNNHTKSLQADRFCRRVDEKVNTDIEQLAENPEHLEALDFFIDNQKKINEQLTEEKSESLSSSAYLFFKPKLEMLKVQKSITQLSESTGLGA